MGDCHITGSESNLGFVITFWKIYYLFSPWILKNFINTTHIKNSVIRNSIRLYQNLVKILYFQPDRNYLEILFP